jgi:hypothetical protein
MATKVRRPAPPTVLLQVQALDDNMLVCRDLRHAWATESSYYAVAVEGGVRGARYLERQLVCMRCDTKRIELVRVHATWIERLDVRYVYAKGYQIRGASKDDHVQGMVRLEQLQRVLRGG